MSPADGAFTRHTWPRPYHGDARPHPVLWQSLCAAYHEPVPLIEMVKVSRAAVPNPYGTTF